MDSTDLQILLEDNHLLAVVKPALLPTMGVDAASPSMIALARDYIRQKYCKPGNVYIGIVSRLDSVATGVLVLARTSKAAARLSEQFRTRAVQKKYWALVPAAPAESSGTLVNWLRKDEPQHKMVTCGRQVPGAVKAELTFRVLRQLHGASLLEVDLITGRKHQIRVQLAAAHMPILGDRKYGSHRSFPRGIALHARTVNFTHPVRHVPVELVAPLPESWQAWGIR